MAKKKKTSPTTESTVKELRSTIKTLQAGVEKAEAKAARWKAKAKKHRTASAKATRKLEKSQQALKQDRSEATTTAAEQVSAPQPAPMSTTPDSSWTVTRLRAAARSQGVVGYSRKSKAELIDALER